MLIRSGILGPLTGKCGTHYVRRLKSGALIIVPRARKDKNSALQREQRRRLSILASIGSKIWQPCLKWYSDHNVYKIPTIAKFYEWSEPYWYEYKGVPTPRLFDKSLPQDVFYFFDYFHTPGSIELVVPNVWSERMNVARYVNYIVCYGRPLQTYGYSFFYPGNGERIRWVIPGSSTFENTPCSVFGSISAYWSGRPGVAWLAYVGNMSAIK